MPPLQDEEQELEGLLGASSRQLGSGSQWAGASATARQVAASCTAAARRLIQPGSEEVLGLWLYVASTAFGTGMSLAAKLAGQHGVPVFEVVLFRSIFLVALTTPRLVQGRINPFASDRQWLLLLRGCLGFCSVSSLYWAVTLLPMADTMVLSFLAPLFVAALSPLALAERPSRGVLAALPLCLLGVLLVAQPGALFGAQAGDLARISTWGVFVGVVQAFFSAAAKMCVRALNSSHEPTAAIVFSMGAVSTAGATLACAALRTFLLPASPFAWLLLAINGCCGYLNQVTMTAALQRTKAASATTMSYCSILWGVLADLLVFHTAPSHLSLLGAAIICGSSFGVAWGEKRARQGAAARSKQAEQAGAAAAAAAAAAQGGLPAKLGAYIQLAAGGPPSSRSITEQEAGIYGTLVAGPVLSGPGPAGPVGTTPASPGGAGSGEAWEAASWGSSRGPCPTPAEASQQAAS